MKIANSKRNRQNNRSLRLAFLLVLVLCSTGVGIVSLAKSKNGSGEAVLGEKVNAATPIPTPFALVRQKFSNEAPELDVNGLFLNPQWGWQLGHEADFQLSDPPLNAFPDSIDTSVCNKDDFSDCAGGFQPEKDEPDFGCIMCNLGNRRKNRSTGHVNWFPATYSGNICFHSFSYPDMDYTFSLQPKKWAGLTRWNAPSNPPPKNDGRLCGKRKDQDCPPKIFHAEFDSRETINRFVGNNEWTRFRNFANPCLPKFKNSCKQDEARKRISNLRAVVIGLVGLDSEHDVYSELHPVYALAIETNRSHDDNTWIIFVRNQGDEGVCSKLNHVLHFSSNDSGPPVENIKLLIPPPADMPVSQGVTNRAEKTVFWGTGNSIDIPELSYYYDQAHSEDNEGVLIEFTLSCRSSNPNCEQLVEGELHLKWGTVPSLPPTASPTKTPVLDYCVSGNPKLADDDDSQEFEDPSPRQSEKFYNLVLKDLEESDLIEYKRLREVINRTSLVVPKDRATIPFVRGVVGNASKKLNERVNELKEIFGLAYK